MLWSMEDVVALIDARAAKPNRPAVYQKRAAPIQEEIAAMTADEKYAAFGTRYPKNSN